MAFKIKQDHLEVLISYMELHPEFATGHLSVVNAKDKFRQLWQELATNLNSLGFGERPVDKWQKTWTDYKTNLKKKASEIRRYQQMTGGGPELEKKLSDFELRVLNLLGKTFIEGCGVKEMGLNVSQKKLNIGSKGPTTSHTKLVYESTAESSSTFKNVYESPGESATNIRGPKRPYNDPLVSHSVSSDDHSYTCQTTPSQQKNKSSKLESIYYETVENLKNIENIK